MVTLAGADRARVDCCVVTCQQCCQMWRFCAKLALFDLSKRNFFLLGAWRFLGLKMAKFGAFLGLILGEKWGFGAFPPIFY